MSDQNIKYRDIIIFSSCSVFMIFYFRQAFSPILFLPLVMVGSENTNIKSNIDIQNLKKHWKVLDTKDLLAKLVI